VHYIRTATTRPLMHTVNDYFDDSVLVDALHRNTTLIDVDVFREWRCVCARARGDTVCVACMCMHRVHCVMHTMCTLAHYARVVPRHRVMRRVECALETL
jgi:hypothetical protein